MSFSVRVDGHMVHVTNHAIERYRERTGRSEQRMMREALRARLEFTAPSWVRNYGRAAGDIEPERWVILPSGDACMPAVKRPHEPDYVAVSTLKR